MNEIDNFLKQLSEIENKYREEQKNADTFNIFTALHKSRDEVRLHSRFISYLLSDSKHGMKDTFLQLFVREILEIEDFELSNCEVIPNELRKFEKDEIDILIINRKQAIIIENKIDAGDSNLPGKNPGYVGQLERYYNVIKEKLNIENDDIGKKNIKIFYLTLDRHAPSKVSIGMLKDLGNWYPIDYGNEITRWLKLCQEKLEDTSILKEIIEHYIKLINKMTGNQLNIPDRKKLQKLIGSSEENMRNAKLLRDNFRHVEWHTIDDFWNELSTALAKFKDENGKKIFSNMEKSLKANDNDPFIRGNIAFLTITFTYNEKPFYVINDENKILSYGIHKDNKIESDWRKFDLNEDEKIILSDFSNEGTFNLINPKYRETMIEKLVNQIVDFVKNKK
jgi:hypothetical protein